MSVFFADIDADRAALRDHLRRHAVRTDGPYRLRSGATSSWYLDCRQTTFDGQGARLVGRVMLPMIADGVGAVGGMTQGADPIAMAIALAGAEAGRPLRAFSIRKAAKEHGTGGRLVGPVAGGDRVTILEDTTTTGGAVLEAVEAAIAEGLRVTEVVCLVDRSGGVAQENADRLGVPFRAVFTPADLGVED